MRMVRERVDNFTFEFQMAKHPSADCSRNAGLPLGRPIIRTFLASKQEGRAVQRDDFKVPQTTLC